MKKKIARKIQYARTEQHIKFTMVDLSRRTGLQLAISMIYLVAFFQRTLGQQDAASVKLGQGTVIGVQIPTNICDYNLQNKRHIFRHRR